MTDLARMTRPCKLVPRSLAMAAVTGGLLAGNVPAWAADEGGVKPYASVHMDVRPGFIRTFTGTLVYADDHGGSGVDVTVHMTKLQPSVHWGPVASVCAVANDPHRSECLLFTASMGDKPIVAVKVVSEKGEGHVERSLVEMPADLHPNEPIKVSLRVAAGRKLSFAVNGRDSRSMSLDFDAEKFGLNCSSMVCDLDVADPLPPEPVNDVQSVAYADSELLSAARSDVDHGHFDTAIEGFSGFIERYPQLSSPYVQRAMAWLGKGQTQRALADLDKALALEKEAKADDEEGDEADHFFYLGETTATIEALRDRVRAKLQAAPCPRRAGTDCT